MTHELLQIIYDEFKDKYLIKTGLSNSSEWSTIVPLPNSYDIIISASIKHKNTINLWKHSYQSSDKVEEISAYDPELYSKVDRHLNRTCWKIDEEQTRLNKLTKQMS